MFKKSFCLLFVLLAACTPFSASAENEASAFLSSVTTEKNRLFETTLSVNAEVAAFVATLEFDESNLEFREVKALSENSEISVNNSDKGKVVIAFVNKYSTEGDILKVTFKAKAKTAFIDLNLQQVINKNAQDVKLTSIKGANVNITEKAVTKPEGSNEIAENNSTQASALNDSKNKQTISIPATKTSISQKIIFVSLGIIVLVAVGFIGFILGRKTNSKK